MHSLKKCWNVVRSKEQDIGTAINFFFEALNGDHTTLKGSLTTIYFNSEVLIDENFQYFSLINLQSIKLFDPDILGCTMSAPLKYLPMTLCMEI